MAIKNFQKDLDIEGNFPDPLGKIMDGEYKVRMMGPPDFYDSEATSYIDFHFCFLGTGIGEKIKKRKMLNSQVSVNFMIRNFQKAGIDVSNWKNSPDIVKEIQRACESMANKIYVIRKRTSATKAGDKAYHDFDIVSPSNDIPPQSSPEEELPF